MYKLKNAYIDKMIENRLSSKEVDFILYISLFQDESGRVESVYYKDVCEKIHISIQKFYDILHNLSDNGLIAYEKKNIYDVAVTLEGNSFDNVDFSSDRVPGYVNVAQNEFDKDSFMDLRAGSKLLYLYSQRFINGKHMLIENFYDEFCRLFNVVKKTLQYYVHELKEGKLLFISMKRNRSYHYEMMMKRSTVLYRDEFDIPREKGLYEDNIASLIMRNFKKYLPEPDPNGDYRALRQIAEMTIQKRAGKHKDFVSLIVQAIKRSIKQQKGERKKNPIINAALVNKLLPIVEEQLQYGF